MDKILGPPGDLLALRGHLLMGKLHEAASDVYLQSLACAEAVEVQRQVANEMAELELQIQALQGGSSCKEWRLLRATAPFLARNLAWELQLRAGF